MLSEIVSGDDIPSEKRAYFQERLRGRLYDLVITELQRKQQLDPTFTQARLASRIGKRSDQVCRWLGSPGNWTLDTLSDLLLGISGAELEMKLQYLSTLPTRNRNDQIDRPPAKNVMTFGLVEPQRGTIAREPPSSITMEISRPQ
jgi:hypothetical protein